MSIKPLIVRALLPHRAPPMPEKPRDPYLLTPGPLTTSASVKAAMRHDWGSRDHECIATNRRRRERLVALAGAEDTHVCVPQQGPCGVLS